MPPARRLVAFLRQYGKTLRGLLIFTHDHPDPDAIASAFALGYLAKTIAGLPSRIVYRGAMGRTENRVMVHLLKIPMHLFKNPKDLKRFPTWAMVDTQPGFGNNPLSGSQSVSLVVDHHPPSAGSKQARCAVIVPKVGATSVILAQALLAVRCPIPRPLATALVYGILSETQNFARQTQDLEIRTYHKILPLCDLRLLALIQNPQKPKAFFLTIRRCLENAFSVGPFIGAHLGWVKTPELVAQTADFLLTLEGMKWSVCTGRYRNRLHISLRAIRPGLHAGHLLQRVLKESHRAGGHWTMAGGSIPVPAHGGPDGWKALEERLVEDLRTHLLKGRKVPVRFPFRA
jgi:nanoRNase/pAp phosphatase (c-di-AMP/oligoRNAs hydrolase)